MKKKYIVLIVFIVSCFSIAASSAFNGFARKMLDSRGRLKVLEFSTGEKYTASDLRDIVGSVSKVDAVNGTATGLTVTNLTALGEFNLQGNELIASADFLFAAIGTQTLKSGTDTPIVLDAPSSAIKIKQRNKFFDGVGYNWEQPLVLYTLPAPVTVTGTTSATQIASYIVPGGTMDANSKIEIEFLMTFTGLNGTKTPRVRWGGSGGTSVFNVIHAANIQASQNKVIIWNAGSTTVQRGHAAGWGTYTNATAAYITDTVNTANNVEIFVSLTPGTSTDSAELQGLTITLIP